MHAATQGTLRGKKVSPGNLVRHDVRHRGHDARDDIEDGRSRTARQERYGRREEGPMPSLKLAAGFSKKPSLEQDTITRLRKFIREKGHILCIALAIVSTFLSMGRSFSFANRVGSSLIEQEDGSNIETVHKFVPTDESTREEKVNLSPVYYKGMHPDVLYTSTDDTVTLPADTMIPPEAIVDHLPDDKVVVNRRKLLEIEEYYTKYPQVENKYATVYENHLPEPFMEGGSCRVGSKLYSLGGFNETKFFDPRKTKPGNIQLGTDNMFVYDMEDMSVTPGPSLPAKASHIACAFNEKEGLLHLTGGYRALPRGGEDAAHRRHWVLDISVPLGQAQWEDRMEMPLPRGAHGCKFLRDGKMYCVGGGMKNYGPFAKDLMIYNPSSDTWELGPPMNDPREHVQDFETLYDGNAILLIGGRSHVTDGYSDGERHPYFFSSPHSAEIYDIRTKSWRSIRPPSTFRRSTPAVSWKRFEDREPSILLVGGETSFGYSGHAINTLEEFDPYTGLYHCHDPLPFPVIAGMVGIWKDKLHIVGGGEWLGFSATRRVVVLDLKKMPAPRNCFYRETPVFDEWERTWNHDPPFPGVFGSINGRERHRPMTYDHHAHMFRDILLNGTAQAAQIGDATQTMSLQPGVEEDDHTKNSSPVYYKGMHPDELYASTDDTVTLPADKMIPPEAIVDRLPDEKVAVNRRKLLEIEEYYTKYPQVENKYATIYENHLPQPAAEGGVCRVGSKIYVLGGFNTTRFDDFTEPRPKTLQLGTKYMFVYDMEDMSVTFGPNLPDRANHIACAYNEKEGLLHLTGGYRQDAPRRKVPAHCRHWVLDISEPLGEAEWEDRKGMPLPRGAHGCKFLRDGKMYCVGGGHDQHGPFAKDLMIYNPPSDSWELGPPMNVPRDHVMDFETLFDGNAILVIGGRSHITDEFPAKEKHPYFFTTSHSAEIYDIRTKAWRFVRAPPTPRESVVSASWKRFEDRDPSILVVGGQRYFGHSGYVLNAFEEFDPYTGLYHCHDPLPFPAHSPAVGIWKDKLHLVGGAEWLGFASTRRVVVLDLKRMPAPRNCFYRETAVFDEWDRTHNHDPPFPGVFGSRNGMERHRPMRYEHYQHLFRDYVLKNGV